MITTLYKTLLPKAVRDKIYRWRNSAQFEETTHNCPLCESKNIAFQDFGSPIRKNVLCPTCQSLERSRALWIFLKKYTSIFTQQTKLLHIAPEKIFFEKFKEQENIDYIYGDKFEKGYENNYPKGTISLDITDLKDFEDSSFDAIICVHVLEHVPDDSKAMSEFFRVLKPNGWAILLVPIDYSRETTYEDWTITSEQERKKHFGQEDHVRWYGRDYPQRLEKIGFKVEEYNLENDLSKEEIEKYNITNEIIYLCTK